MPKLGLSPENQRHLVTILCAISETLLWTKCGAWCICFSLTMFCSPHSEGEMYSEELRNIVKCGIAAAIVGMVYGGLPGARHARERFIQLSQAAMYQNRVDAVVRDKTGWKCINLFVVVLSCFVHTDICSNFPLFFKAWIALFYILYSLAEKHIILCGQNMHILMIYIYIYFFLSHQRSTHNAAIRGFVSFGSRWSWRVAAFVTLFK